jgi:hypothetical protein
VYSLEIRKVRKEEIVARTVFPARV